MIDFNYLRLIGISTDKILVGPQKVELEINTPCNLNCIFCWFHSPGLKNKPAFWNLSFEKFKEIVTDLKSMGTSSIFITGQGEPSLNPDFTKIIRLAKKNNLHVTLTTNLTFNSPNIISNLKLADRIEINLCTIKKNLYEKIYRPNSVSYFNAVIKNLKMLQKETNKIKQKIFIVYVLNKFNTAIFDEMLKFIVKNGFGGIKLHSLNYGNSFGKDDGRNKLHLNKPQKKKFVEHIYRLKQRLPSLIEDSLLYIDNSNVKKCYMGWFSATIGCRGNVWIGCGNKSLPPAGNIYKQSFKNIWLSSKAGTIRKNFKYTLKPRKNHCPLGLLNTKIEKQLRQIPVKINE